MTGTKRGKEVASGRFFFALLTAFRGMQKRKRGKKERGGGEESRASWGFNFAEGKKKKTKDKG